jgi:hypothetical protein
MRIRAHFASVGEVCLHGLSPEQGSDPSKRGREAAINGGGFRRAREEIVTLEKMKAGKMEGRRALPWALSTNGKF